MLLFQREDGEALSEQPARRRIDEGEPPHERGEAVRLAHSDARRAPKRRLTRARREHGVLRRVRRERVERRERTDERLVFGGERAAAVRGERGAALESLVVPCVRDEEYVEWRRGRRAISRAHSTTRGARCAAVGGAAHLTHGEPSQEAMLVPKELGHAELRARVAALPASRAAKGPSVRRAHQ